MRYWLLIIIIIIKYFCQRANMSSQYENRWPCRQGIMPIASIGITTQIVYSVCAETAIFQLPIHFLDFCL